MALYCIPADCTDPALRVVEAHCNTAETRVRSALSARGLTPDEVASIALPHEHLRALAIQYACAQAALEGSRGEDTTLMAKHHAYEAQAKNLAQGLTRAVLGLELPAGATGGYGSIPIGRA